MMSAGPGPYWKRGFRLDWRAWVVACAVLLHGAACVGLLLVWPGTEANPSLASRAAWVAENGPLWRGQWMVWMAASSSLLAFMVVWGEYVAKRGVSLPTRCAAYLLVGIGLVCDWAGEIALIAIDTGPQAFAATYARYQVLSPGAANGLYCSGGLLMSAAAGRIKWLTGGWAYVAYVMWGAGLTLSAATALALQGSELGRVAMIVSGGTVMLLFMPWATYVGWKIGRG